MKHKRRVLLIWVALVGVFSEGFSQTFTSSNLPIIVINTNGAFIADDPKTPAEMGIIDNGPGVRNEVTDPFNDFKGRIGIERRGSSSQMFPKNQYGIELWSKSGADSSAALLGMPEEEDWVLFAPYNDKTLMRDVLAYDMARKTGRYAPRTRYCELLLNGEYQGVYVLIEKIKRDNERVDISRLNPDEISGDDLTGGYILKIDKMTGNGGAGFNSTFAPPNSGGQKIYFQYEYPDTEEIVSAQAAYIKNYMDLFEKALASPQFHDATNGFRKYADADSFVDFMIINEASKNVDGYRLSTYLHKKKDSEGGKIFMGPVWDFNLGFGNADYCTEGNPQGFVYNFNTVCGHDDWLVPFWWGKLLADGKFKSDLGRRWKELREGPFKTSTLHANIDSVAAVLGESQQRNFQRWPVMGKYVWPNYYVGTSFSDEVRWLKEWIVARMSWLDGQWGNLYTPIAENVSAIKISPNPSSAKFVIHGVSNLGVKEITVLDAMGRSVSSSIVNSGDDVPEVDMISLPDGLYFLRVEVTGGDAVIHRVVKKAGMD